MVNYENSSPEQMPKLVSDQWHDDEGAGVDRGVDELAAAGIGYTDPETLPPARSETEIWAEEPNGNSEFVSPAVPKRGSHSRDIHDSSPRQTSRLRGVKNPERLYGQALSNSDGPPAHIPDARRTY